MYYLRVNLRHGYVAKKVPNLLAIEDSIPLDLEILNK